MKSSHLHCVTAIITFHKEGLLAHRSLLSLARCRDAAERAGIEVEIIATLDRADSETTRVVRAQTGPGAPDQILTLDLGDLGMSRNTAVDAAKGQWILICDGDDYLSADFITRCVELMRTSAQNSVLHPQLIITFGTEQGLWWQVGSDDENFDPDCMLICNPWNSCCFAARETFISTPYQLARPGESGFGFEDWHWNCETLATGCPHLVVNQTIHYVRKKESDSLNRAHSAHHALIPPSRLFAIR